MSGPLRTVLSRLDGWANRLYGSRFNPLYQSGSIAVGALAVLLVTGVYLLFVYRIGDPWNSVARTTAQPWTGRWIRSLHRYASDVAVVAVAVHALRMLAQRRTWGPRALAWLSGLLLLGALFVCGWTGYVMVWDGQALVLAREGARLLDALPLFSEPLSRAFSGERPLPGAFFFMNLFLHVALPVGLAILLWVHVSRVARPVLLPPRGLSLALLALLLGAAVLWPVGAGVPADAARLTGTITLDAFYAFWLPITRELPAWLVWIGGAAAVAACATVPRWSRPPAERRPAPSVVDERLCTGCTQCMLDCPYTAITMVRREQDRETRSELVARVDPTLCVSCGICAGSCAPMGVGPPERTGRDQLAHLRHFLAERRPRPDQVIVVACRRGAPPPEWAGAPVVRVDCAGNLHTSVIELMIRGGAGGVLVAHCPERDCRNREGPKWLQERVYHDREAELKERVDRRRVRLVEAARTEDPLLAGRLEAFQREVLELAAERAEADPEIDTECEPPLEPDEALTWRER